MRRDIYLQKILADLPEHYRNNFSKDFLNLLAALTANDFAIRRADEAADITTCTDLWPELSHPSIWIYSPSAPTSALKKEEPGTPKYTELVNATIRENLIEQQRLLSLLKDFYKDRTAVSFEARLIVETYDLGESNVRPQGASIRILLNQEEQSALAAEYQQELRDFTKFLIEVRRGIEYS